MEGELPGGGDPRTLHGGEDQLGQWGPVHAHHQQRHGGRLSDPLQLHCLEQLLQLAHEMNKPVVLHVVRCYQEIFALLKRFSLRVMVHGFCGSPELLDELWKRDITVSFPVNALKKTALMDKLTAPRGRFGFESDCNQNISVNEIINKSMIPGVEKMTDQYFNDFLGI